MIQFRKMLVPLVFLVPISSVSGLLGQDGVPLVGHHGAITYIDFSPDGKLLLTGCVDATARVWSLDEKKEIAKFPQDGPVLLVRFVGNDKAVVVVKTERPVEQSAGGKVYRKKGNASEICVWDVKQQKLLYEIDAPASNGDGVITDCAVSPDGKRFAVRMVVGGRIRAMEVGVFDVSTGDAMLHRAFRCDDWTWSPGDPLPLLHFADAGAKLVTVESERDEDHLVGIDCQTGEEVYNVPSGARISMLAATKEAVGVALWQPRLKDVPRGGVRTWNASTGEPMATTKPMNGLVTLAGSSKDSLLICVDRMGWTSYSGVALLDVRTNQMRTLVAQSSTVGEKVTYPGVGAAAIDREGRRIVYFLTYPEKVQLRVVDLLDSSSITLNYTWLQLPRCTNVKFSPDGQFLVASCKPDSWPGLPHWELWPTKLLTVWDLTSESSSDAGPTPSVNPQP